MSAVSYLSRAWLKMWGVAAGGTLPALSVQTLVLLPVFMAAILSSGCRPILDHVTSFMSESAVGEKVGIAVEMLFVVVIQADITCIYAACFQSISGFPAVILNFWKVTDTCSRKAPSCIVNSYSGKVAN